MRFVFIIFGKRCDCDCGVLGGGGCAALGPGAEVAECGVGEEVSCKRGFEIYVQGNRRKNPPRLRRTFDIKSILFYVMALDNSFSSRVDFQRIPFLKQKQYCFLLSDGQVP